MREIITGDDPDAELCIAAGVDHDYRPYTTNTRTYNRCVWCHAVSCGDFGEVDGCVEHWHHEPRPHRTASGVTWPIGGDRPKPTVPLCLCGHAREDHMRRADQRCAACARINRCTLYRPSST